MKRCLLRAGIVVALLLQAAVITAQQAPPPPQEPKKEADAGLTKEEKAELIKLSLELALVQKRIPDYNIIEKQYEFLLSTENITAEMVPHLEGINLALLEPKEIRERAESRGDYVYYFRFRKFETKGEKVFVYLDNVPMYAKNPTRMAFGGGITVEFQKKDGEWVSEINESWIV